MSQLFENSTLRFRYPAGWSIDQSQSDEGTIISLQSPGAMFAFLTVREDEQTAVEIADRALETMRDEYPELDSIAIRTTIARRPAIGHDVNFFSLDLTNTCWIRALRGEFITLLVFAQTTDLELAGDEPLFRAICASIELIEDDGEDPRNLAGWASCS